MYQCSDSVLAFACKREINVVSAVTALKYILTELKIEGVYDSIEICEGIKNGYSSNFLELNSPNRIKIMDIDKIRSIKGFIDGCNKEQIKRLWGEVKTDK